jgi:hypothetical protein
VLGGLLGMGGASSGAQVRPYRGVFADRDHITVRRDRGPVVIAAPYDPG